MPFTLINSFVIPPEQEQGFVEGWGKTKDYFASSPGFIEATLYRNTNLYDKTFLFVNVAQWETAEQYHSAVAHFSRTDGDVTGFKAHPGLYQAVEKLERRSTSSKETQAATSQVEVSAD